VDALRGIGRALETVSTLALMCDPRDIGQTLGDGAGGDGGLLPPGRDPFGGRTGGFDPTVFLFDAIPGGVGLAPRIYERIRELLPRARAVIEGCDCQGGCPACVGPTEESGSRKRAALDILVALELRDATPAPGQVSGGS
jgi:DEAD/DEAH box helicase domain-containing protein